jgi:hypothetical protein
LGIKANENHRHAHTHLASAAILESAYSSGWDYNAVITRVTMSAMSVRRPRGSAEE